MNENSKLTTVCILGDQLSTQISSLQDVDPKSSIILMVESFSRARKLPYHKKKLIFLWSSMRHFAEELRGKGYKVDYRSGQSSFRSGLMAHIQKHRPRTFRLMQSAEFGGSERIGDIAKQHGLAVQMTNNNMFISEPEDLERCADSKGNLLLERFYRGMRKKTGILMNEEKPVGGKWNYDSLNRESLPEDLDTPVIPRFCPDKITQEVIELVNQKFPEHFGKSDEFSMPVTREQADRFLRDFLENRLDLFGPYEDAIRVGEYALFHSLLSPLLNVGLLDPLDVCLGAEQRYQKGKARLQSVEGFIRQIIGWREFVYQTYHSKMPKYKTVNFFSARKEVPDFYWTANTKMACVKDSVTHLIHNGMIHHIQRLMVTGNFALISGMKPQDVNDWYALAYVDAFDWVVTPNVLGLSLYADGGIFATKPYASSGKYIHRMSDCCEGCDYDYRESVGENACPYNSLYWDFLSRNEKKLSGNPRMKLILSSLRKMNSARRKDIQRKASRIRRSLNKSGVI